MPDSGGAIYYDAAIKPDNGGWRQCGFQRGGWRHAAFELSVEVGRQCIERSDGQFVEFEQRAVERCGELFSGGVQCIWQPHQFQCAIDCEYWWVCYGKLRNRRLVARRR